MQEDVSDLEKVLKDLGTDEIFASCIGAYIRGRGSIKFKDIPGLKPIWNKLAESQDLIGWDNFMEGKISKEFRKVVRIHLIWARGIFSAEDWSKQLVDRIIKMTHGQWLYRNAVVHEQMSDGLTRIEQEDILARIEEQFDQGADKLREDDEYLLEVDFETLWSKSGRTKKYWLRAIESARKREESDDESSEEEEDVRPQRKRRKNKTSNKNR